MEFRMICKNDKKMLALYAGLALLFIYPLIQAGVFYRDDLDRAITGQYGWRGLGRPMADILMKILSASGHYNLDLFPYTMIASCLFIGAASLMLSKHLVKMDVPNEKLVAALLIFNPFFLQNIAYRYDSLGMSIAFFLALAAYTYSSSSQIREYSVKVIAGVLSLTLYQPCANIFIALLAIDIVILAVKSELTVAGMFKTIVNKASLFIGFFLVYMLFFASKKNSRAELIHPNQEGFAHLLNTVVALKELILSYFYGPVYIYFLIPVVIAFLLMLYKFRQQKSKSLAVILYCTVAFFIFLVSLMGPTILLVDAPVAPRAIVSFSTLLVMIAVPVVFFSPRLRYISLIPVITAIAFSAQLSSALKSQREYEDLIFNMVTRDLINIKNIHSIGTVGQINIDERAKLLMENKPLIGHFLSPASQFLASFQLINKGFTQTTHGYGNEDDNHQLLQKMLQKGINPVIANSAYSLYVEDGTAIVKLGGGAQ
ncbi:hypothetical protein CG432_12265 [Pantoea ananatis]|nr:hypothetical protein CG432_12265 [Pantoea ananatis]